MVATYYSSDSCPFDQLRYLVVEDSNTMRVWLRNALGEMGGKKIEAANSYTDALYRIRNRAEPYDVVLCDYLLSDTRDGQQLLEEVKRTRLLPTSAIWLMITGENSYEQVFSAAELSPDDYLLKPVSPAVLHTRLEKAWARRQAMKAATELFDAGQYKECIAVCQEAMRFGTAYTLDFRRQIGEALLAQGLYREAHGHYEAIVAEKPNLPWARLGAARAYFMLDRHDEAQDLLEQLALEHPDFLHAQDLLAKVHEKKGDLETSKQILDELISRNPKALHRHREVVRTAMSTGDVATAMRAFDLMHTHGKGSSFLKPADFCAYAGILVKQGGVEATEKLTALNKQMQDFYHGQPEFDFAGASLKFSRASLGGDKEGAERAYKAMQSAMGAMPDMDNEQRMAMLQAAVKMGDEGAALGYAKDLYFDFCGNERMLDRVDALIGDEIKNQAAELKRSAQQQVDNLNRRAVDIAKSGKLREAVDEFIRLAEQYPVLAIVLNAAVAIIKWMEDHGEEPLLANKLEQYIHFIRRRDPDNPKLAKIVEARDLFHRNVRQAAEGG